MELKTKTIKKLQEIIKQDYGKEISEEDAQKFGKSLLRLTKLAIIHMAKNSRERS